uniref:DNA2/NAM7 helicase-like C-terminal domain-containing protein n=1 Tax=Haptolina brevifila TaxID=156173 RepID=A0A7S2E2A3_9EUKA
MAPSYRLLTTQWRMHQSVADWSSSTFYDGRLRTHPSVASRLLCDMEGVDRTELTSAALTGISVAPTSGQRGLERRGRGGELTNVAEVDAAVGHAAALLRAGVLPSDIVIISPYTAQVALLKRALADADVEPQRSPSGGESPLAESSAGKMAFGSLAQVEVATVDSYQGREAEAVILSLVRSNPRKQVGFLSDHRRLNVAVTRARRHVAVVCDPQTVSSDPVIASLLDHVAAQGSWRPPSLL